MGKKKDLKDALIKLREYCDDDDFLSSLCDDLEAHSDTLGDEEDSSNPKGDPPPPPGGQP